LHNEAQLLNGKSGECIRHKQYSECISEVDQEMRQIWAIFQDKLPGGDLYPVTISYERDSELNCHESQYAAPVQLGINLRDHSSPAQDSLQ
jgi:hypothetical protein